MTESKRGERKTTVGLVVSDKMEKTITVQTETKKRHPLYKKFVKHYTKYYAHDEENQARQGDLVEIMETRPLSKNKRWRLVRVISSQE